MEQLVPITTIEELWIEGEDPDSLERAAAALFAAEAAKSPSYMVLDFQIAGGAGGSQYRVGFPFSPVAFPGSILASNARASFAIAQGASELNRVMGFLLAKIQATFPTALVRFVQFGSANGDGAHLVGAVWQEGPDQSPYPFTITRAWNCRQLPTGPGVDVAAGTKAIIQSQDIVCDATQVGRGYIVWWNFVVQPAQGEDPSVLPTALEGDVEMIGGGGGPSTQQVNQIECKIGSMTGTGETEDPFVSHWIADGDGQCFVIPGVTGPAFTVGGPNTIMLECYNPAGGSVPVNVKEQEGSFTILEVAGDLSSLVISAANQP